MAEAAAAWQTMKTLAYCDKAFYDSVFKASGVEPLTSPPLHVDTFRPHWLQGYDFLYFKLHGLPSEPRWYGQHWITALEARHLKYLVLTGTIVFVANCYLWHTTKPGSPREQAPMLYALLDAGARAIVGGPGINYAKAHAVYGADILGQTFRRFCALGVPPTPAFKLAMTRVKLHRHHKHPAMQDVLSFKIFDTS